MIVTLLVASFHSPVNTNNDSATNKDWTSTKFVPSDNYLQIYGNKALEDLGLQGNGTEENPFLIANQSFSYYGSSIEIRDTDLHLLIENCSIHGTSEYSIGIQLLNSSNVVISHLNAEYLGTGIESYDTENIRIEFSQFHFCNLRGVSFDLSTNIAIRHCNFSSVGGWITITPTGGTIYTQQTGKVVTIYNSNNVTIENNDCIDLDDAIGGFDFIYCQNIRFTNNTIDDVSGGLHICWCTRCIFNYNEFGVTSIILDGDLENMFDEVVSNFVDGKNLGIFLNESNLVMDGNTLMAANLIGCQNITIGGGVFSDRLPPIGMWNCINCTLDGIDLDIDSSVPILINNSQNCRISSSTNMNEVVISYCDGIQIIDCDFADTPNSAIHIDSSEHTTCINNTIIECHDGISVVYSYYTEIIGNWIELSETRGIDVEVSRYGTIMSNSVLGSKEEGIILSGTSKYNICYNILGWNQEANAIDDGSRNLWDDQISQGNNYSDYIGHEVYYIDGTANSIDYYPSGICKDYWNPSLIEPSINPLVFLLVLTSVFGIGLVISKAIWDWLVKGKMQNTGTKGRIEADEAAIRIMNHPLILGIM